MANLLDLGWLKKCAWEARQVAEDPKFAQAVVAFLEEHPEVRADLEHLYRIAQRTLAAGEENKE